MPSDTRARAAAQQQRVLQIIQKKKAAAQAALQQQAERDAANIAAFERELDAETVSSQGSRASLGSRASGASRASHRSTRSRSSHSSDIRTVLRKQQQMLDAIMSKLGGPAGTERPPMGTLARGGTAMPVLHGNTRQAKRMMLMEIHVQRTVFKRTDLPECNKDTPYEDILDTYYMLTGVSNTVARVETMKKVVWSMFFIISAVNDMFKRPLKLRGMMTSLEKSLETTHSRQLLYKISMKWFKDGRSTPELELLMWLGGLVLGTAVKNGGFGDLLSHVPYLNSMLGLVQPDVPEEVPEDGDKMSGAMRLVGNFLGQETADKINSFLGQLNGSSSGGKQGEKGKEGGNGGGGMMDMVSDLMSGNGLGSLMKQVMSAMNESDSEEEKPKQKPRRAKRKIHVQRSWPAAKPLSDDAISTTAADPFLGGGDDI